MFKFSTKSLNKLNKSKVHPLIKKLMLESIKTTPIDFTIIETIRTLEQQKIYLQSKTTMTLKSRHIPQTTKSGFCEAIDIAPCPVNWKDINKFKELSQHIKATAQKLNMKITWGGDWKNFKDYPHYQLEI